MNKSSKEMSDEDLDIRNRRILLMWAEGVSIRGIAQELGIPIATVNRRLKKIRKDVISHTGGRYGGAEMSLVIEAPPVPLRTDEHGVLRVGKTRVPLDTVVYAFNQGASPEEIAMSYPTLALVDVYAVVNYYVHNRDEVDNYIRQREVEAASLKVENEKRFPQGGIRARLLARRQKQNEG